MLNELAKAGVLVGAFAALLYAPWYVPEVKAMVTYKVTPAVELWYHGDVIDSFDTFGECADVLPVGPVWACRIAE